MNRPLTLFAVSLLALGACGTTAEDDIAVLDSGPHTDLSVALDLAQFPDFSGIPGPGADAGTLVAQCQAMARNFQENCAGTADRVCMWGAYVSLCASGQTQLLLDAMECLNPNLCRTFSDPNDSATCLAGVHSQGETAAARSFIQNTCSACAGTNCQTVTGQSEIFPYLTDADIASVGACRGNACDLDSIIRACPKVPGVVPFVPCAP